MKGHKGHHHGRHHKAGGGEVVYEGKDSKTAEEAKDKKDGFKRGGHVKKAEHHVEGAKKHHRMDRPGRRRASGGRADHSPFSTASKVRNAEGHDATEGDASEGD